MGVQGAAVWVERRWHEDRQRGRPVRDTQEEAFNPGLEMWVWTPLEAGAGDTDLDASPAEVTADS